MCTLVQVCRKFLEGQKMCAAGAKRLRNNCLEKKGLEKRVCSSKTFHLTLIGINRQNELRAI